MANKSAIWIPWPKWQFVVKIGEGSFGKVYEIKRTQSRITERSALKIIRIPSSESDANYLAQDASAEDKFFYAKEIKKLKDNAIKEVKNMQDLSSARNAHNIVSIQDWDERRLEDGQSWEIAIRMELLTPLTKMDPKDYSCMSDEGLTKEVIKLGVDICSALDLCERRKIIHRDIKPSNIFKSEEGDYKLGDFGIARQFDRSKKTATNMTWVGAPAYMAPEIYKSEKAGPTIDLYSLGIVMYEILNEDRLPLVERARTLKHLEDEAIVRRLQGEDLPPPSRGSEELKRVILKACAYKKENRFQHAAEMREALECVLRGDDVSVAEIHHTLGAEKMQVKMGKRIYSKRRVEPVAEENRIGVPEFTASKKSLQDQLAALGLSIGEPTEYEATKTTEEIKGNPSNTETLETVVDEYADVEVIPREGQEFYANTKSLEDQIDYMVEETPGFESLLREIRRRKTDEVFRNNGEPLEAQLAALGFYISDGSDDADRVMSIEELEKDLFGENVQGKDDEATRKIEKFFTLYKKNEEFLQLLDDEYEKLQGGFDVPRPRATVSEGYWSGSDKKKWEGNGDCSSGVHGPITTQQIRESIEQKRAGSKAEASPDFSEIRGKDTITINNKRSFGFNKGIALIVFVVAFFVLYVVARNVGYNLHKSIGDNLPGSDMDYTQYVGEYYSPITDEYGNELTIDSIENNTILFNLSFYRLTGMKGVATFIDDNTATFDNESGLSGKMRFEEGRIIIDLNEYEDYYFDTPLSEFVGGLQHVFNEKIERDS